MELINVLVHIGVGSMKNVAILVVLEKLVVVVVVYLLQHPQLHLHVQQAATAPAELVGIRIPTVHVVQIILVVIENVVDQIV